MTVNILLKKLHPSITLVINIFMRLLLIISHIVSLYVGVILGNCHSGIAAIAAHRRSVIILRCKQRSRILAAASILSSRLSISRIPASNWARSLSSARIPGRCASLIYSLDSFPSTLYCRYAYFLPEIVLFEIYPSFSKASLFWRSALSWSIDAYSL